MIIGEGFVQHETYVLLLTLLRTNTFFTSAILLEMEGGSSMLLEVEMICKLV